MKAESQCPAGDHHQVTLATSSSTRFRRMPTPYRYLRCGGLRSPGVIELCNGPLGLHNDEDDDYMYAFTQVDNLICRHKVQSCCILPAEGARVATQRLAWHKLCCTDSR